MPEFALLISDRSQAAFFDRVDDIALAEVRSVAGCSEVRLTQSGSLRFIHVTCDQQVLPDVLRLSCVQGIFDVAGDSLIPRSDVPDFRLHADFVWGEKYRGKTSEILTQLMISLGRSFVPDAKRVIDPMCGRGTTLIWAMRYGMQGIGVEQDGTVLGEVRRGLKKWSKLHRQKHKLQDGWVQKTNKKGIGQYLDFAAEDASMRIVIGDSVNAFDLVQRKQADLLVTDLPYGVQHMGGKGSRNPLEVVAACAPGWNQCLVPGGAMVIAFNTYQPKRTALAEVFSDLGLEIVETDLSHRMSESILRDILVLRKPA